MTRCQTLDCYKVAEGLVAQLEQAEDDRRILRTLHVTSALARSDIVGIIHCLQTARPAIESLLHDENDKVCAKAQSILRALQEEESGDEHEATPAASATRSAHPAPLLDLLTLDTVCWATGSMLTARANVSSAVLTVSSVGEPARLRCALTGPCCREQQWRPNVFRHDAGRDIHLFQQCRKYIAAGRFAESCACGAQSPLKWVRPILGHGSR